MVKAAVNLFVLFFFTLPLTFVMFVMLWIIDPAIAIGIGMIFVMGIVIVVRMALSER